MHDATTPTPDAPGSAGATHDALPAEARTWALWCHLAALSGLVGVGFGFLLGPLVVWLIKRGDHPFIDEQGKEAVNFQITMCIAMLVAALLMLVLIGFLLLPLLAVANVILVVLGAVKANQGEHYRYPVTIRFIR